MMNERYEMNLKGKSFLKLLDFTSEEILGLIDLAADFKIKKKNEEYRMSITTNYLEQLYKREPNLFLQRLKKSNLTETDLQEIEKSLGYTFPQQYKEFLQEI